MAIKSIRLQNFKGFKDVRLELKPLTVLLGPNSAGKSSFGQALVALSKSNARGNIMNLSFGRDSSGRDPSIEFGSYSDLAHDGSEGEPVKIVLDLGIGTIAFGFGGSSTENPYTSINQLDLTYLHFEPADRTTSKIQVKNTETVEEAISQVINLPGGEYDFNREYSDFKRITDSTWIYKTGEKADHLMMTFNGVVITGFAHAGKTIIPKEEVIRDEKPFMETKNILEKVSYIRPDREQPYRKYKTSSMYDGPVQIDDWGAGASLYVHAHGDNLVDTFYYPPVTSDQIEARENRDKVKQTRKGTESLREAVSKWYSRLGLAGSFETRLIDGGTAIQALVTLPRGTHARPLTDVGFGTSQVLPILVKGLSVKKNGIFVVEQPEAQLHPRPQAELADFFCSMVKCGRNVLLETHSEALFHRLRILADMDDELSEKIAVYFIDEPKEGDDKVYHCCEPKLIPLTADAEFDWPVGFLPDGVETEMQVYATRLAKKKEEVKH